VKGGQQQTDIVGGEKSTMVSWVSLKMRDEPFLLNEENDGEIENYSMDLGLYFQRNLSLIWRN
jgi:hypothetical protein